MASKDISLSYLGVCKSKECLINSIQINLKAHKPFQFISDQCVIYRPIHGGVDFFAISLSHRNEAGPEKINRARAGEIQFGFGVNHRAIKG